MIAVNSRVQIGAVEQPLIGERAGAGNAYSKHSVVAIRQDLTLGRIGYDGRLIR